MGSYFEGVRCTFRQASLLTHPDFALFKGLETCLDTLWLRFRFTLNVHALPHYPKKSLNITILKKDTLTGNKKEESHNPIIKGPAKTFQNVQQSLEKNKTLQDYQNNDKILRNNDLLITAKKRINGIKQSSKIAEENKPNQNFYQALEGDEENDFEDTSISSEAVSIISNESYSSEKNKSNSNDNNVYNINTVTIGVLNTMIKDMLTVDRSKLKTINGRDLELTMQLLLHEYQT